MSDKTIYSNIYPDTSRRFHGFGKIFSLWKGSVFKLIWHDLLLFLFVYGIISVIYRFVLFHYPYHRELFELICVYMGQFSNMIPITFLTGFYVSQVVSRWWDQFMSLPWPEDVALRLVTCCPGKDHFKKNLRRTVMRYLNLSSILTYRLVSEKVRKRFPSMDTLLMSKLILPHEIERLVKADSRTPHESTWVPIMWALKLLQRARSDGKITVEGALFGHLINNINRIESQNRKILNYGWVNFPLAYTQVATVSVFIYFMAALFGRQYLIPREDVRDMDTFPHVNISYSSSKPFNFHTPDFYIPFFSCVEYICYMGWIKVAETLLNPFGDDDEDFQINYIIDRNLQVSYLIVDEAEEALEMAEDPFLEAGIDIPKHLPEYEATGLKAPNLNVESIPNSAAVSRRSSATFLPDPKGSLIMKRLKGSVSALFHENNKGGLEQVDIAEEDEEDQDQEASNLIIDEPKFKMENENKSHITIYASEEEGKDTKLEK